MRHRSAAQIMILIKMQVATFEMEMGYLPVITSMAGLQYTSSLMGVVPDVLVLRGDGGLV